MGLNHELYLGNGQHTLFSDDLWYLIRTADTGDLWLEARFQTDAPDRTGYPAWTGSEFCVECEGETATCRIPLARLPKPGEPRLFPWFTDAIWEAAIKASEKVRAETNDV